MEDSIEEVVSQNKGLKKDSFSVRLQRSIIDKLENGRNVRMYSTVYM